MFSTKYWSMLIIFLISISLRTYAATNYIEPTYAYWIFSGIVTNESGERFGYFFQMKRQGVQFQIQSALLNEQTNKVIFSYDKKETVDAAIDNKWKVGDAFLRFNPINNSWVFGVKTAAKTGFNFKVDMLNQPIEQNEIQNLRLGLEALVHQTNRLNGHIQADAWTQEQFVTANNAWFSKTWLSKKQASAHDLQSSFCRFADGSGFYAASLQEIDAKRAAFAIWRDALGNSVKMSQFITSHLLDDGKWKLTVMFPKVDITMENQLSKSLAANHLAASFFHNSPTGYCFLTEQYFTEQDNPAS